jgi:hypothetical protein
MPGSGSPIEGQNCLAEATQIIECTDERIAEADVYRVRGDLLNATGDQAGAEQSQALAVAQRQRAKLFELHAATSLARLWRDQGKRIEARNLLAPSTTGSPKASTRRFSKRPNCCSVSLGDTGSTSCRNVRCGSQRDLPRTQTLGTGKAKKWNF